MQSNLSFVSSAKNFVFSVIKKYNIMEKKKYVKPRIELIFLDNDISLALESTPPAGPLESNNNNQSEFNKNEPFNV